VNAALWGYLLTFMLTTHPSRDFRDRHRLHERWRRARVRSRMGPRNRPGCREAWRSHLREAAKRRELPLAIDDAVAWSRTKRGGKDVQLIRPSTGCERWGICEAPKPEK
jgi:hypothetical protein